MVRNLLGLQSKLREVGVLICFSGRFSQGIIEELGEAIKKHMEAQDTSRNNIFNVFSIFIEQTQNVKNYASSKEGTQSYDRIMNSGIVTIGKMETGYFICSGNQIENADVEKLSGRLDAIIRMDKDELKKRYKEQLKKEIPSDSMGAGLGLLDIARKSSQPLEYSIQKLDDQFSFYELLVIV